MSFYWQQGMPQQDPGQSVQQPTQQGPWDFINLGGAPAPQFQWNPAAQQQQQPPIQNNYYYQNTPTQEEHRTNHQPQLPSHHQQFANPNYPQQWAQNQSQQQSQTPNHMYAINQQIKHQPQLSKTNKKKQNSIDNASQMLPDQRFQQSQQLQSSFSPAPPVLNPYQQTNAEQQRYQRQQPSVQYQNSQVQYQQSEGKEVSKTTKDTYHQPLSIVQSESAPLSKEIIQETLKSAPVPAPEVAAPPVPKSPVSISSTVTPCISQEENHLSLAASVVVQEPKTKITPTSSEDDWEKADMEVQRVEDENKRQDKVTGVVVPKPTESRESSSLGGSWSQQDTEPSARSSTEPEILEHPVKIAENKEEETPRVSMSENHEGTPTLVNTYPTLHEVGEESPEAGHPNQSTSIILNSSRSPMEAIATSTPNFKHEKRSSASSQGTLDAEKKKSSNPTEKGDSSNQHLFKKHEQSCVREELTGNDSDSTIASGRPEFERGHARASYREYKKTYMEICDRLKFIRTDSHHSEFRPSSKLANPLLAAAGLSRLHPAIRRESAGGRNDGRASVPLHYSQSFTENVYPENNGGRRSRVSRLDPNGRPSSRQTAGYHSVNHTYNDSRMTEEYEQQRYYQQQNSYRAGRHSAMAVPYDQRKQPNYFVKDAYAGAFAQQPQETSSLSESEEDNENAESDDELRRYNMQHTQRRIYQDGQYQPPDPIEEEGDALYYCGVVHVNMDTWRRIKNKYPIPPEFNKLNPIEKAAFMFYTVVFKQPYKNVDAFHKRFNREFYKYACVGDSNDDALFKVCRSMQQQYLERQKEKEIAYQNMKATLFSDDTSLDGQSEINSVNEDSLNACDIYNNGPLKFTCPHSFLHISTGGQIISIQPDQSISAVVFDDIKSVLKDIPTIQVKEAAMTFKGPLVPHQSAPHTVRLYISKQIENIKRSAVAMENPEANDVVESLLVWQLLETMVKQQGNITGPDIAELLAKVANQPVNIDAPPQQSNITPALNQFTQFLLGGHIDEAVESAIRNGLFADALVLTRRLFPNDERRIEQIESRFLQTRSFSNPVTTLVTVAKGEAPPVLTNPPLDDHLSWRTHAAIILANLDQRGTAMHTIYQLGRALAKRDYHCAADFCFLVGEVLGGTNPFEPIQAPEGEEEYRRYISLVNSDIPDNESNPKCQYGFLLTDLHATEIFDYALRLKPDRESPLARSINYQTARIKYAKLLANHGFNTDAYRYCTEIARAIWSNIAIFNPKDLLELCDLAESLHFAACVDPSETRWIQDLRAAVQAGFTFNTHVTQVVQNQDAEKISHNYHHQHQTESAQDVLIDSSHSTAAALAVPELDSTPAHSTFAAASAVPELGSTAAHSTFVPTSVNDHQKLDSYNQQQQYYPVKTEHAPPTPAEFVHQEQHDPLQYASKFSSPSSEQQPQHSERDNLTFPSEYNDSPLTMTSSQPIKAELTASLEQTSPIADTPADESQPNLQSQKTMTQVNNSESQGWQKTVQSTAQKAIPDQNPTILPANNNSLITHDSVQAKHGGEGVKTEPSAPRPPTAPAAPAPPVVGGGLRTARGVSRYAKVGLGSAALSTAQAPTGMMLPTPQTATFGFMPAPVDDDADSVDPFSGPANPTIQQSTKLPPDER